MQTHAHIKRILLIGQSCAHDKMHNGNSLVKLSLQKENDFTKNLLTSVVICEK